MGFKWMVHWWGLDHITQNGFPLHNSLDPDGQYQVRLDKFPVKLIHDDLFLSLRNACPHIPLNICIQK
jgi:hypothetical protein